ncbi:MAG: methyltransferase domain-containing protein [Deltaproteobacteria bacterium]|nr:methyltransferase domain-containing protein [Deltaproteobacteria bacterium]
MFIKFRNHTIALYKDGNYNSAFSEMLDNGGNQSQSILYDISIFNKFSRIVHSYAKSLPETTLHIGPGGSLGCEVLLCLSGIKKAWSLDPCASRTFDLQTFILTLQKLSAVTNSLQTIHQCPAPPLSIPEHSTEADGSYRIGTSLMQHFPNKTLENTGLQTESVGFLFSNAVLEHVRDPLQCIREAHRILAKKGLTAHQIDLRDHRDFSKPLHFLRYSDSQWQTIMNNYCARDPLRYMNRLRARDFLAMFESAGFRILEFTPNSSASDQTVSDARACLATGFERYSTDELKTTSCFIVAQKS